MQSPIAEPPTSQMVSSSSSTLFADDIKICYIITQEISFDVFSHKLSDAQASGPINLIIPTQISEIVVVSPHPWALMFWTCSMVLNSTLPNFIQIVRDFFSVSFVYLNHKMFRPFLNCLLRSFLLTRVYLDLIFHNLIWVYSISKQLGKRDNQEKF